jgi:hypothetical protein
MCRPYIDTKGGSKPSELFYNLFVLGSYFLKSAVEKSNRPGVFLSEAEKYRRAYNN